MDSMNRRPVSRSWNDPAEKCQHAYDCDHAGERGRRNDMHGKEGGNTTHPAPRQIGAVYCRDMSFKMSQSQTNDNGAKEKRNEDTEVEQKEQQDLIRTIQ